MSELWKRSDLPRDEHVATTVAAVLLAVLGLFVEFSSLLGGGRELVIATVGAALGVASVPLAAARYLRLAALTGVCAMAAFLTWAGRLNASFAVLSAV